MMAKPFLVSLDAASAGILARLASKGYSRSAIIRFLLLQYGNDAENALSACYLCQAKPGRKPKRYIIKKEIVATPENQKEGNQ